MTDTLLDFRLERVERVVRAVYVASEDLLGQAVQLAPKDEGTLRGSGAVALIVNGTRHEGATAFTSAVSTAKALTRAGATIEVEGEVSFNTIYAARIHEEIDWNFQVGQSKYLEQPLRENTPRYQRLIEAAAG